MNKYLVLLDSGNFTQQTIKADYYQFNSMDTAVYFYTVSAGSTSDKLVATFNNQYVICIKTLNDNDNQSD